MFPPVEWLSDKVDWQSSSDPEFTYKIVDFYSKFRFKHITAEIGDYVLVSNADSAEPDTDEGCDVAQIVKLYESHDKDLKDRYRARVLWFSKPGDVPANACRNRNVVFHDTHEVVEDHRPFSQDVSIETFHKQCRVVKMPTTSAVNEIVGGLAIEAPTFVCRYRIVAVAKRKFAIEPVLEDERRDYFWDAPTTPKKTRIDNPKNEWVVKSIDKSKLTLKRDTTDHPSPGKLTKAIGNLTLTTPKRRAPKHEQSNSEDEFESPSKKLKLPTLEQLKQRRAESKARKSLLNDVNPSPAAPTSGVPVSDGALRAARESLRVASVPRSLPCREQEFNDIYTFVEAKISEGIGGCMYISGVPGTGKTATVTEVLRCLNKRVKMDKLPEFDFIEINGMRLTEPRQAYVQIYKQLTGKTIAWEQACKLLENRFTKPAPRRNTTVLLVDELDILCNRRQDVLYNLLDWPSKSVARLIVIAIANTMDLPERLLMGRVASRLGLTRLTFQPYTHDQLRDIVSARLSDTDAFDPDAIQLVSRKVAAVSGDARRALDICRRAVELAEYDGGSCRVSLGHVNGALMEMIASPKVRAIKCCSKMEKLFLQATVAEIERSGLEECVLSLIQLQFETICAFVGVRAPSITQTLSICSRLGSFRLIICDNARNDIDQKILLNVSADDVYYATQKLLS